METLSININEAVTAIKTIGVTNTILLRGQPGIGKSSTMGPIKRHFGDAVTVREARQRAEQPNLLPPVAECQAGLALKQPRQSAFAGACLAGPIVQGAAVGRVAGQRIYNRFKAFVSGHGQVKRCDLNRFDLIQDHLV